MYKPEQFFKDINKKPPSQFKYGVIDTAIDGERPYVKLDGEASAKEIGVPYLSSYTPVVGDKVILSNYNGYVILGKII